MMKTLADALAVLQGAIRDTHTSRSPERRKALFGMVEHFQEEALGPIRLSASLAVSLETLQWDALAYSRTRQAEQDKRDALFRKLGVDLAELSAAAEHAVLDGEAALIRPDYDANPVPSPIRSPHWS